MSAPDTPDPFAWMQARGALAHVRPDLTSEELIAMARDEMTDTHDAPDHAAEIHELVFAVSPERMDFSQRVAWRSAVMSHADALAAVASERDRHFRELLEEQKQSEAENAALVAYARAITALARDEAETDIGDAWHTFDSDDIDAMIAEHGVAALIGEGEDG